MRTALGAARSCVAVHRATRRHALAPLCSSVLSWTLQVITFDAGGVSGHPNHIDTHRGVAAYARQSNAVPCYELETVPLARKFTSALDALASAATTPAVSGGAWPASVMVTHNNPGVNDAAMRAHASQYVWFRKLFVYFSRYTFVNTLRRMTPQRP